MRNRIAKAALWIGLAIAAAAHIVTYVALGDSHWISLSFGLVLVSSFAAVAGVIITDVPRTQKPSGRLGILAGCLFIYVMLLFVHLHQGMGGAWSLDEV